MSVDTFELIRLLGSRDWSAPMYPMRGFLLIVPESAGLTSIQDVYKRQAFRFMEALTRRLQVSSENLLPSYDSESESTEPVGYILPVRRRQPEGHLRWSSQLWFPRPERLVLAKGDSPIGFRIPTESIPWVRCV